MRVCAQHLSGRASTRAGEIYLNRRRNHPCVHSNQHSERISKTDASGEQLKEAQSINKSLSALGDVIAALGERGNKKKGANGGSAGGHIPFRNSKLTYLLQPALQGDGKVSVHALFRPPFLTYIHTYIQDLIERLLVMIICLSPRIIHSLTGDLALARHLLAEQLW
jgi:hypothetical protein